MHTRLSSLCLVAGLTLAGVQPAGADPRTIDPWAAGQDSPAEVYEREELLEYLSEDWRVLQGRYVRFYAADRFRTHPAAVRRLEDFIEETMDALGMTPEQRRDLERNKIRYFLCGSAQEVQLLGGEAAEGITLLERRAVVTRWLPHEHEIVHLLANLTVGPAPSGTEPLLQEGLACALGGRRGMGRRMLLHQGDRFLATGDVEISRLWGHASFHTIAMDPSENYAAAGRFVQFLLETRGMKRFLALYRLLSGSPAEVALRPARATVMQVEEAYGRSWFEFVAEFHAWRVANPIRLIETAAEPLRDPDLFAVDDGRVVSAWNELDGSMVVRLDGQWRSPEGLVLWGPELPATYRSRLLPGPGSGAAGGRRFGLKLSGDRIDLYDFVMDRLVAHLELGGPGSADLAPATVRRITVRILPESLEGVERPAALILRASPVLEP